MSRRLLLAAGVVACFAVTVWASDWRTWRDLRVVATNGRFYVVIRETEEFEVRFAVAERKPGTPAPESLMARSFLPERPDPEIRVREGDIIHAEGEIEAAPEILLVSSRGLGFAALGGFGPRPEHEVSVFSLKGELLHVLERDDLKSPSEAADSVLGGSWLRGAWMDDDRGEAFLFSKAGHLRAVSFATGKVRRATSGDARRALEHPDPDARVLALEFLVWRREGSYTVRYAEMYESEDETPAVKLRAGVALAALGDRRGVEFMIRAADSDSEGFYWPDREYAKWQTAALVKRSATPDTLVVLILEDLRKFGLPDPEGESAIPLLASLLTEYGFEPAAERLAETGSLRALPVLIDALASKDVKIAEAAGRAAIELGGADVADLLAEALQEGSGCDGILVTYFQGVRHPIAPTALTTVLERGTVDRDAVQQAVRFQQER